MRVIGLTGGIGSGKSTVASLFQALGVPLVDTDQIAHALSQAEQPGAVAVGKLFGAEFLDAGGAIDRARLRSKVFSEPDAKRRLEAVLHPLIRQQAMQALACLPAANHYSLLAVPLLFETGAYSEVIDRALVVDCPESLQIARVMRRSQLSEPEVLAIMAKQLSRAQRLARADDVILNDGNLQQLTESVHELHKKYLQEQIS